MADTTPSTDGGQAPTGGSPQAGGTPTIDGQAPVSQTTLPTDHEKIIEQLRKENAAARKRLDAFEQAQKELDLAKLGETEKLQKQYSELQAQHETLAAELLEARVYQDVARHAAKLNFILPADMLAKLLLNDLDAIEFEDGKPKNIETLLQNLAKATPEIVKNAQQEQQQQKQAPLIPAGNPGRTNYGPSTGGQQQQGTRRNLFDPGLWKT